MVLTLILSLLEHFKAMKARGACRAFEQCGTCSACHPQSRVVPFSWLTATRVSALSLSPSCTAWQQPACVWGHRDPLWGEQWQRCPRLQRQVQEMGSAQLPRKETQPNLRPGTKDEPCRNMWSVCRSKGESTGSSLSSAGNQCCAPCTEVSGKPGVSHNEIGGLGPLSGVLSFCGKE